MSAPAEARPSAAATYVTAPLPGSTVGRFLLLMAAALGASTYVYRVLLVRTLSTGAAALVGVGVLGLAVAVVYLAAPVWQVRAARLRTASAGSPTGLRVRALAEDAGLHRAPQVYLRASQAASAKAFGALGRYRIALDAGLVVRLGTDPAAFDATVRHELAHIRSRDVELAWLSIAVAMVYPAVVIVPDFVFVGGVHNFGVFMRRDLWRLTVLTAAVYLVLLSLMRSRELAADARAAEWSGTPEPMLRVLATAKQRELRWIPGPLRTLLQDHPSRQERQASVVDATRRDPFGPWAAFAAGLTAGLAASPLGNAVEFVAGPGQPGLNVAIVAALVGGLLSLSTTVALLRRTRGVTVPDPAAARPAARGAASQSAVMLFQSAAIAAGVLLGLQIAIGVAQGSAVSSGPVLQWALAEIMVGAALVQFVHARWLSRAAAPLLGAAPSRRRVAAVLALAALVNTAAWTPVLWLYRLASEASQVLLSPPFSATPDDGIAHQLSLPPHVLETWLVEPNLDNWGSAVIGAGVLLAAVPALAALARRPPSARLGTRRTAFAVAAVAIVGYWLALPFTSRLLVRSARQTIAGNSLDIDAALLGYTVLPVVLAQIVAATGAAMAARRSGAARPGFAAYVGALGTGAVIALLGPFNEVVWTGFYFVQLLAAGAIGALVSVPVAVGISCLIRPVVAVGSPEIGTWPTAWRRRTVPAVVVTCVALAGWLGTGPARHTAQADIVVPPLLSAADVMHKCLLGTWRVARESNLATIAGKQAIVDGGDGMQWVFAADGTFQLQAHGVPYSASFVGGTLPAALDGTASGVWSLTLASTGRAYAITTFRTDTMMLSLGGGAAPFALWTTPQPTPVDCENTNLVMTVPAVEYVWRLTR